jgi:hypothetical protein
MSGQEEGRVPHLSQASAISCQWKGVLKSLLNMQVYYCKRQQSAYHILEISHYIFKNQLFLSISFSFENKENPQIKSK